MNRHNLKEMNEENKPNDQTTGEPMKKKRATKESSQAVSEPVLADKEAEKVSSKGAAQENHLAYMLKEDEPKPKAALAVLELHPCAKVLVSCEESSECDFLGNFLVRYGFKVQVLHESRKDDISRTPENGQILICQRSMIAPEALLEVPLVVFYNMVERPDDYEALIRSDVSPSLDRTFVSLVDSKEAGSINALKKQCRLDVTVNNLPSAPEVMTLSAQRIMKSLIEDAHSVELSQFLKLAELMIKEGNITDIFAFLLREYLLKQKFERPKSFDDHRHSSRGSSHSYEDKHKRPRRDRDRNSDRDRDRDRDEKRKPQLEEKLAHEEKSFEPIAKDLPLDMGPQDNFEEDTQEDGIARLYVTLGQKDGFKDLASLAQFLSKSSGVDLGHFSGSGMIRDHSAHIEVDSDVATRIMEKVHGLSKPGSENADPASGEPNTIICERAKPSAPRNNRRHFGGHRRRNYNK